MVIAVGLRHRGALVIRARLAEEIGENPDCAGNREGFGDFAPIRVTAGIGEKQRYPHEQSETYEHQRQETGCEKSHLIRKKGKRGECE
jgi:hypothetical protein